MILQHAHRVVWMDHRGCGFDWDEVKNYRPDEVWWKQYELTKNKKITYQTTTKYRMYCYPFEHVLIQDVAYQSLLRRTRQQYHQRIAQVFNAQFPETVETQPELLAHHYTAAGLPPQAIPYWQRAGARASTRSANAEALSHLTVALELLQTLPDTPERRQQELTLLTALGTPLVLTKGHAAPEVEATYARARALCQQRGDAPQLFAVAVRPAAVLSASRGAVDGARAGGRAPPPRGALPGCWAPGAGAHDARGGLVVSR